MLQLQTKEIDICRVSKLLAKHNIKSSITDSVITLDGDVSDELVAQLCGSINISAVQNFISKEQSYVPTESSSIESEEIIQNEVIGELQYSEEPIQNEAIEEVKYNGESVQNESIEEQLQESYELIQEQVTDEPKDSEECIQNENVDDTEEVTVQEETKLLKPTIPKYDLIYPVVKRGQAYWCDLGEPYEHEIGGMRPVIVVSNDRMNMSKRCNQVVVIPCSTTIGEYSNRYNFTFSSKTMFDYDEGKTPHRNSDAMAEEIRVVSKSRLRELIGTMKPQFMKKMQDIIDDALQLERGINNIVTQKSLQQYKKETEVIQDQLLSNIDMNDISEIVQSDSDNQIKAQKILELFGFDLEKNGVLYLLKAITLSTKQPYFTLENLCEKVSRRVGVAKEEIMRLIVARVKERFSFKKAPTIEFIRLVNSLLLNQEEGK